MLPYSYLVLSVIPTSNETNVNLDTKITINFAKHINPDTLNSNCVRLRKINGDFVEYKGQYNHTAKTYTLTPLAPLEPGTQYQTIIVGGKEGVLSVDGGFLPDTKNYGFSTVQTAAMSDIPSLELKQDYLFVKAKWELPAGLATGEDIHFEVRLSTSKNPDAFDLWPNNPIEGKTTATEMVIPQKLEAGKSYYVHVKGVTARGETAWLNSQIYMEPITQEEAPAAPQDPPSEPDAPGTLQLSLVDHSPQNGVVANSTEVVLVFNDEVLLTDNLSRQFFIVEAPYKESLTFLDMRGSYSAKNAVPGQAAIDPDYGNVLIWTPGTPLKNGKEYTVMIDKSLAGVKTIALGYTYHFGFTTTPEHFHGDYAIIKEMAKQYGAELSDRLIHSLMKKHSQYACDIWMNSDSYDEELHQDGDAPYFVHEYVNTQASIDALMNVAASSSTGSESIKLSDLSVTKEASNSSSLTGVIATLQEKVKDWEDLLHGHHNRGYAKPGSAVKGENAAPYPEPMTRSTLRDFDA